MWKKRYFGSRNRARSIAQLESIYLGEFIQGNYFGDSYLQRSSSKSLAYKKRKAQEKELTLAPKSSDASEGHESLTYRTRAKGGSVGGTTSGCSGKTSN